MRRTGLFIILIMFWIALTWSLDIQRIITGLLVAFLAALLFSEIFFKNPFKILSPKRLYWLIRYIPIFLIECLLANIDVAYRVIHPKLPIKPGIVKVKTTLKTDLAKTMLANSITLTPGTMSVDIEGEYLYIHWIFVESQDMDEATRRIVLWAEKYIRGIFE